MGKHYNFLLSLDRNSIDKEVVRIGVEGHMFWELPKVRDALNELCKKWSYNDCKAYNKNTIDISEDSPTHTVTLIELWRLRRRILEDKTEILIYTRQIHLQSRRCNYEQNLNI